MSHVLNDQDRASAGRYHAHHINCLTCMQAGRRYGDRCQLGQVLWLAYQTPVAIFGDLIDGTEFAHVAAFDAAAASVARSGFEVAELRGTPDGNHGGYFSGAHNHD